MSQFCEIDENNAVNQPAPCRVGFFQKQLNQIAREAGTELRIIWAPEFSRVYAGNYVHRPYALYRVEEHRGWKVYRPKVLDGVIVGMEFLRWERADACRESIRERYHYFTETNEIWEPDVTVEEVAPPRWVIEEKVSGYREQVERLVHNEIRYDTDPHDPKVLIDFMGPYPHDGYWDTLKIIAQHEAPLQDGEMPPCCNRAWKELDKCWGKYRPPDERDLEYIRGLCQAKVKLELVRDPTSPPTVEERRRWWREYESKKETAEQKMRDYYVDMFVDAFQPAFNAHYKTRFDIGRSHQKAAKIELAR